MTVPKISVVVPVYNLEFYIARCLESLARQTIDHLEVVVVNDGGVDDSQSIIDEYVAKYPKRFVSYIKENGGHGSACNFGIAHATGEYVMIVDGDDFLDDDSCEYMYEKIQKVGADLLIGNLMYLFADHREPYHPLNIDGERMLDANDRKALFMNWPTPCGRLYRRSMFERDPELQFLPGVIFADANFAPKSYLVAQDVYYVNKELYNYDITRPTQSLKQTDKRIMNIVPVLRDMLDYYRRKGEFEAYRNELRNYVARHCVSWLARIKVLQGYPKVQALKEVFAVADDNFGSDWLKCGVVYDSFGRKTYWQVKVIRWFGYGVLAWLWNSAHFIKKADNVIEKAFLFPLRCYQALRRRIVDRLAWLFA